MKRFLLLQCLLSAIFWGIIPEGTAQSTPTDSLRANIMHMSLEELLKVKIGAGSILGLERKESPTAITIISKEQIQTSPANNISELLEYYTPGLIVMTHSEGNKIGLRGLIAAENYKLLILLNGVNITNTIYEGVITEVDMWDMDDIELIEVIRGPGSVTHGSGAIAGVINIITKSAEQYKDGLLSLSSNSNVTYNSVGGNIQFATKKKDFKLYTFGSFQRTSGLENPNYYVQTGDVNTTNRYVGTEPGDPPPQNYRADGLDRPQLKLHCDLRYKEKWKLWVRYTQSGQTYHFKTQTPILNDVDSSLNYFNQRHVQLRSFAIQPEFTHRFNKNFSLKARLGFDTQEYTRYDFKNTDYKWDHSNNTRDYAFSQPRITARTLLNYSDHKKIDYVLGIEFTSLGMKAPWGGNEHALLIREGSYFISDTLESIYYTDPNSHLDKGKGVEQIGTGVWMNTISLLGELKYKINSNVDLLASTRIDKPDFSNWLVSPRISAIWRADTKNTFRLTAQRSLRMMPLRAQYLFFAYSTRTAKYDNEKMNSLEVLYTHKFEKNFYLTSHSYLNKSHLVGFTGRDLEFIGNQSLYGFDLELIRRSKNTEFGINHAFVKQISFDFNDELKDGTSKNNITFSDYSYVININNDIAAFQLQLTGYGNDINNIPRNITKLYLTQKLLKDKVFLNLNLIYQWDFIGSYNEMRMYEEAYNTVDKSDFTSDQLALFDESYNAFLHEKSLLEKEKAYLANLNLNASISYKSPLKNKQELFFSAYAKNITNTFKRYYVSTGSSRAYPNRLQFFRAPISYGFKLEWRIK